MAEIIAKRIRIILLRVSSQGIDLRQTGFRLDIDRFVARCHEHVVAHQAPGSSVGVYERVDCLELEVKQRRDHYRMAPGRNAARNERPHSLGKLIALTPTKGGNGTETRGAGDPKARRHPGGAGRILDQNVSSTPFRVSSYSDFGVTPETKARRGRGGKHAS